MEVSPSATGLIFWNAWYRASPEAQFEHIQALEEQMALKGTQKVLLCLSEATQSEGLVEVLQRNDYDTAYRATSAVGNYNEGLCFAQKGELEATHFTQLSHARAIANVKTRWLGQTTISGLSVLLVHASYPTPTKQEVEGLIGRLAELNDDGSNVVLGGDFNTVLFRRRFIGKVKEVGMNKVDTVGHIATLGSDLLGLELDHVFVNDDLIGRVSVTVGERGPSNHRPLLVTIDHD